MYVSAVVRVLSGEITPLFLQKWWFVILRFKFVNPSLVVLIEVLKGESEKSQKVIVIEFFI